MAGYAIGAAGIFWLVHDLPLARFLHLLAGLRWWLLAVSALPMVAAYVCVAWGWQLMLRAVGELSFLRAAQAVFAGRFANDALPVHAGYIVRAYLASRWMGAGLTAMAPSLILERLWDGLWIALIAAFVSWAVPLPAEVAQARNVLAIVVLGGVAATAVVLLRHRFVTQSPLTQLPPSGMFAKCRSLLRSLAEGINDVIRSRVFLPVLFLTFVKLALQAAAILIMLRACGIELSFVNGLGIFVAAYLAISIPTTPGSAGLFQVLVVNMLGFFGVGKPEAAGFSLVSFVMWTLPPAVVGFFAMGRSGLTLRQIRRREGIR